MSLIHHFAYFRQGSRLLISLLLVLTGCTFNQPAGDATRSTEIAAPTASNTGAEDPAAIEAAAEDVMPSLFPVELAAGETLQVVATTNIVADIVGQIGGDHIALHTLMAEGIDPHSYTTTPQDMRTMADADVIFMNGVHLEEALDNILSTLSVPVVPVSVGVHLRGITPTVHDADHHHDEADPHTWQSVANVKVWVENIRSSLSQLDPAHADAYQVAATAYQQQLDTLDAEARAKIAAIPVAKRKLVTDHDTFGYFARDYEFTIIGALIPSLSTTAEPSAQAIAALQDQIVQEDVQALFVGTTVNPRLAEQLGQDLGIPVVSLYSDSLSAADGPAATYLDFMRYNVNTIVGALQ